MTIFPRDYQRDMAARTLLGPPDQPSLSLRFSSAAAHGHHWLVRAESAAGGSAAVNLQMRRLKLLEFALAAACPRLHRFARRSYNRLGPPLARICRRTAWLADAAYAALEARRVLGRVDSSRGADPDKQTSCPLQ